MDLNANLQEYNAIDRGKLQALTHMAKTLTMNDVVEKEIYAFKTDAARDLCARFNAHMNKGSSFPFYFITVSPPDHVPFQILEDKVNKAISKNWITHFNYSFEQRSEDHNKLYGFHAHILLARGTKRPSELKREFKSTFTDWNIDIKGIKEDLVDRPLKYLRGIKVDPAKQQKCEVDKIFRNSVGIKPFYTCNCETACPLSWKASD